MKNACRFVLFVLMVAWGAFAWPQNLEQRVTFSSPAKRLEVLAAELTQQTGVPIRVDREVANEVVVVQVRDVPLSELLLRIASVTASEAARDAQGNPQLRLSREVARRQQREELVRRIVGIRASQRQWEEELAQTAGFQVTREFTPGQNLMRPAGRQYWADAFSPLGRAMMRLTLLVRPEVLAGLQDSDRVVFSTHPNRMQQALGPQAASVIADFVRERQAELRREAEVERSPEEQREIEMARRLGVRREPNPMTEPVAEALLIATAGVGVRTTGHESIQIEMRLYDAAGNVMIAGLTRFLYPPVPMGVAVLRPPGQPVPDPVSSRAIQLSPLAAEMHRYHRRVRGQPAPQLSPALIEALSPALIEAFRRPDLVEPHALVTSEATMAVAAARGLQLVANFPDTFGDTTIGISSPDGPMGAPHSPGAGLTVGGWERSLAVAEGLTTTRQDGWMLIQPLDPTEARENRTNRPALAQLIRAVEQHGTVRLVDLAEYAARHPRPVVDSVPARYFNFWGVRLNSMTQGQTDWNLLRLYGLLTEGQRRLLINGGQIMFATLDQNQRQVLNRLLFRYDARFEPLQAAEGGQVAIVELMAGWGGAIEHRSYRDEPTELMPNGLPRDGLISVELNQTHLLQPDYSEGTATREWGNFGLEEFVLMETFRQAAMAAGDQQGAATFPVFPRAKIGTRQELRLTFHVTRETVMRGTLVDDAMPRDARPVDMANLPPPIAAQVQRYQEAFQRAGAQVGGIIELEGDRRGRQAPPPTP